MLAEHKVKFDHLITQLKTNIASFVDFDLKLLEAIPLVYRVISSAEGLSSLSNLTNITFGHKDIEYKTTKNYCTKCVMNILILKLKNVYTLVHLYTSFNV